MNHAYCIPATAWVSMILSAAMAGMCYWAAGPTLGLFIGGIVFAALLLPPLVLSEQRFSSQLCIAAGVNDGIGVVWLVAVFASPVTLLQWVWCYLLLMCWCAALWAIARLIGRLLPRGSSPALASAAATVIALLWITWPLWLSPHLSSDDHGAVAALTWGHPIFAANSALRRLGVWTQHPIAYRHLTRLGQDVPYELPPSVWPACAVHLAVGALAGALSRIGRS